MVRGGCWGLMVRGCWGLMVRGCWGWSGSAGSDGPGCWGLMVRAAGFLWSGVRAGFAERGEGSDGDVRVGSHAVAAGAAGAVVAAERRMQDGVASPQEWLCGDASRTISRPWRDIRRRLPGIA